MIKEILLWIGAIISFLLCLAGTAIFALGVYGSFVVEEGAADILAAGISGLTIAICAGLFTTVFLKVARS